MPPPASGSLYFLNPKGKVHILAYPTARSLVWQEVEEQHDICKVLRKRSRDLLPVGSVRFPHQDEG